MWPSPTQLRVPLHQEGDQRRSGTMWKQISAIGACSMLWLACGSASAQVPKTSRTADGKPNMNGIWQAMNSANWDLEDHEAQPGLVVSMGALDAVPPGVGVVEGGVIPYLPAAALKKQENHPNRLKHDPEVKY